MRPAAQLALALGALSFLPWSFKILASIGFLKTSTADLDDTRYFPESLQRASTTGTPSAASALRDISRSMPWGVSSFLVPLAASIAPRAPEAGEPNPLLLLVGAAGLTLSLAFVVCLWLLQRFGLMTVFYAPRYPALTVGLWGALLRSHRSLEFRAGSSSGARPPGFSSHPGSLPRSRASCGPSARSDRGGLREMRARFAPYLPPSGGDLYVMLSELRPLPRDLRRLPSAA